MTSVSQQSMQGFRSYIDFNYIYHTIASVTYGFNNKRITYDCISEVSLMTSCKHSGKVLLRLQLYIKLFQTSTFIDAIFTVIFVTFF